MPTTYRIATVARRTGLTADTIRAWERRYGMIAPERTASGERRYSDREIARLELVKAAVDQGHAVRDVARLTDAEIKAAIERPAARVSATAALEASAAERTIQTILDSVSSYDLASAEAVLNSAALFLRPTELIVTVLAPLMHAIGDGWQSGRFAIAQEHFTTHLVRNVVGSMLRVRRTSTDAPSLFLTPPDESHELGILFAAALCASKGLPAIVLGANVPLKQAVAAARGTGASQIIVGLTCANDVASTIAYVTELRKSIASSTALCLGGPAAIQLDPATLPDAVTIANTLTEYEASLMQART